MEFMVTGRLHYFVLFTLQSPHVGVLLLLCGGESGSMMEGSHTYNTVIVEILMFGILGFRVEGIWHLVEVVEIPREEIGGYEETTSKLVLKIDNSDLGKNNDHDGRDCGIGGVETEHVGRASLNIDRDDTPQGHESPNIPTIGFRVLTSDSGVNDLGHQIEVYKYEEPVFEEILG